MTTSVHEIFHITPHAAWEAAKRAGRYRGDTLDSEGFIHCSTRAQVIRVANARFAGRTDLILLTITVDKVGPAIRWEEGEPGERFPHIYGPLNLDAVAQVAALEPGPDGGFDFPTHIVEVQADGRFVPQEEVVHDHSV